MYLYEHSDICRLCDKKAITRSYCKYHYEKLLREKKITPHKVFDRETKFLMKVLHNVNGRCLNPHAGGYERYGGKGIKNLLSIEDLRYLYHRDEGSKLQRPSIDRRNSDGDYTLDNCRFIEWRENAEDGLIRGRAAYLKRVREKKCTL